jgi:quercetin dioxygenase-like cupin family protein
VTRRSTSTTDEHDAPHEIEVLCLEGNGFVSLEGNAAPIGAGEAVRWPAGHPHRLWTEGSTMVTLMVERPRPG